MLKSTIVLGLKRFKQRKMDQADSIFLKPRDFFALKKYFIQTKHSCGNFKDFGFNGLQHITLQ